MVECRARIGLHITVAAHRCRAPQSSQAPGPANPRRRGVGGDQAVRPGSDAHQCDLLGCLQSEVSRRSRGRVPGLRCGVRQTTSPRAQPRASPVHETGPPPLRELKVRWWAECLQLVAVSGPITGSATRPAVQSQRPRPGSGRVGPPVDQIFEVVRCGEIVENARMQHRCGAETRATQDQGRSLDLQCRSAC